MNMETINDAVLFVDDEPSIISTIKRGLIDESFDKLYAESGAEALEILEQNEVSVLVTDMRMPVMNGLELLSQVQEKYPDVVRIILTGYSQITTLISAINTGQVYRFLTKPWKFDSEFLPAIKQAIEYHSLIKERKNILKQLKSKNLELNKRNFEIQTLLEQVKRSNNQKNEILFHLTKEVIPFVEEVLATSGAIVDGAGSKSTIQFKKDMQILNEEGKTLYQLVRKVEESLLDNKKNK